MIIKIINQYLMTINLLIITFQTLLIIKMIPLI